ncbi:dynamin family protein [Actinomyces ruminis]|uniref:dynamin family protein n=1 Tax=Actinomyces ruminis TaxID=1937003 RepID=UPI000B6C7092
MSADAGTEPPPSSGTPGIASVEAALDRLRDDLSGFGLPYTLAGADSAARTARIVRDQLGDYVLPRLKAMDAPLLAVVGGSTGAGKSALVSSLVRRRVAVSSAIRPTTRRPLLLHATGDGAWFDGSRVLGSLAHVRVAEGAEPTAAGMRTPREVEVRSCSALPSGLAILDAPDVDSVVDENRELSATLLAAADLWIFVTTASRYADAVVWEHLRAAAARDVVTAVILNRVPAGAGETVANDLRRV